MIPDAKLSEHFSLYDLTRTDRAELQEENRNVTPGEVEKLRAVANLLEACREVLGCDLEVHSARRSPRLNRLVGGSDRSQHLKCEAADFSPKGPDTEEAVVDAWQKIVKASRDGKLAFGQIIVENQARYQGRSFWVHISLGAPYRDVAKCGEVLCMKDGTYTLISKVPVKAAPSKGAGGSV